jgi:hypothetical protein
MSSITGLHLVLGLPTGSSIPPLVSRSTTIRDAIAADKVTFPTPNPPMSVLTTAIDGLTAAQSALKTHSGTRAARDAARMHLVTTVKAVGAYVQQLCDATPDKAAAIAQAATMRLRNPKPRHKSDLTVKQLASGVVKLVAKATTGGKAHDWQYSADGGKTWIDVPSTTRSTTTITGLQPGVVVHFRKRVISKTGVSPWPDPVSAMVI